MKNFLLIAIFLALISLVFSVSGIYWWQTNSTAPSTDASKVGFVIARNEPASSVVANLFAKGLIKSTMATKIYLRTLGLDQQLKPGAYEVSKNLSLPDLFSVLTKGPRDLWVTIPEGWRREQVAARFAATIPGFDSNEFLLDTTGLEGQLFPDTYLIPAEATVDVVTNIMAKNFAKKSGLTLPRDQKTLILASLIEREARKSEERPLIASVLHNRLEAGMALQVDATVQYATDSTNNLPAVRQGQSLITNNYDYWEPISDTKFPSPYNTYLHPGLPPGPIASPGLASIQAALVPASTDYLYYMTGSDGVTRYALTLSEHNRNVQKYLIDN